MGKHKKKPRNVIQEHHLVYQKGKPEEKIGETVLLYKGEHWAITLLQRRKNISKGFIRAIEFWLDENKEKAIRLTKK